MERRAIRVKIVLAIAISLAVSMSSAYVCYYTVAAADFLSPNPNFETFDQEVLLCADAGKMKVFTLSNSFDLLHLLTFLIEQSSQLFSPTPSLYQKTLILRC